MELRILQPDEDKGAAIFSSEDCQQLLAMYDEYCPKNYMRMVVLLPAPFCLSGL